MNGAGCFLFANIQNGSQKSFSHAKHPALVERGVCKTFPASFQPTINVWRTGSVCGRRADRVSFFPPCGDRG